MIDRRVDMPYRGLVPKRWSEKDEEVYQAFMRVKPLAAVMPRVPWSLMQQLLKEVAGEQAWTTQLMKFRERVRRIQPALAAEGLRIRIECAYPMRDSDRPLVYFNE